MPRHFDFRLLIALLIVSLPWVMTDCAQSAPKPEWSGPGTRLDIKASQTPGTQAHDLIVWLPEGYDPKSGPYSVVYVLDGQNMLDPSPYSGANLGVAESLCDLMKSGRIGPTLAVGISSGPDRNADYMPDDVATALGPDLMPQALAYAGGHFMGNDFADSLVNRIRPMIAQRFAVAHDAAHTIIIGASMGAHAALYIHGRHPEAFGASASLSMPWLMYSTDHRSPDKAENDQHAVAKAFGLWLDKRQMNPKSDLIYIDQGTEGIETLFTPYKSLGDAEFIKRGWAMPVYDSEIIAGAHHSERDWRARMETVLMKLLPPAPLNPKSYPKKISLRRVQRP